MCVYPLLLYVVVSLLAAEDVKDKPEATILVHNSVKYHKSLWISSICVKPDTVNLNKE